MTSSDISNLKVVAKAIADSGLPVNGNVRGKDDEYELVSYVDEVVILDSLGQEVVAVPIYNENED